MRTFSLDHDGIAALLDPDGTVSAVSRSWLEQARLAARSRAESGVGRPFRTAFEPLVGPLPDSVSAAIRATFGRPDGVVHHEYPTRVPRERGWWRLQARSHGEGALVELTRVPDDVAAAGVMARVSVRVLELDLEAGLVWANDVWLRAVDEPLEKQEGRGWLRSVHPADQSSLRVALSGELPEELLLRARVNDKTGRWGEARLHVRPRCDHDGRHVATVVTVVDVTEEVQERDRNAWRATHDDLTGLAVRSVFVEHLRHELTSARRDHRHTGVLFADLDGFKQVNDQHGHLAGDELLRVVARRIAASTRPGDVVSRFGGDEFVVLLPRLDRIEDAHAAASRVVASSVGDVEAAGVRLPVRLSVGVVLASHLEDPDDVLRVADEAMYEAKQLGGNQHVVRQLPDPAAQLDEAPRPPYHEDA